MIHIKREGEPEFWKKYRTQHPKQHYDDLQATEEGKEIRRMIRQHNIEQQHGLCAYCCREITKENSLNEHIRPKGDGRYANLSMRFENIVACCSNRLEPEKTCSDHKQNDFDERLFVSPLEDNCESFFEYYPNGQVVSDSPEGKYTIDLLNLNAYRLRKARAAQLKVCDSYGDEEIVKRLFLTPDADNRLKPFIDIVKYFYK